MTKLGVHVASAARNGLGTLLEAGAALVVGVDQGIIAEAKAAGAVAVFRTQAGPGEDNPVGIDHEPLERIPARALEWMQAIEPVWKRNPGADYYLVNNEWDIGTRQAGEAIGLFALECMRYADERGYKVGILNFSTGCPSDDPVDGAPLSMEERLDTVFAAMFYATTHGHALSLHVHAVEHGDLQHTGEYIALRFQRLMRYCVAHGFRPKILITELSNGVGGIEPNMTRYLAAMRWWDQAVQASPFADSVLGGALYGFNAAETIAPAVKHLANIMSEPPVTVPPPEPEPEPVVRFTGTCSADWWTAVEGAVMRVGGTISRQQSVASSQ